MTCARRRPGSGHARGDPHAAPAVAASSRTRIGTACGGGGGSGTHEAILTQHLAAVAAKLEDKDGDVREAAVAACTGRSSAARRRRRRQARGRGSAHARGGGEGSGHASSRASASPPSSRTSIGTCAAAVKALGTHEAILAQHLAVAAKLEDKDGDVRKAAVAALAARGDLTQHLAAVAAMLEDRDRRARGGEGSGHARGDPHAALSRRRRQARGQGLGRARGGGDALATREAILTQHSPRSPPSSRTRIGTCARRRWRLWPRTRRSSRSTPPPSP